MSDDPLDCSKIGVFEADKIDGISEQDFKSKVKKMIPCVGLYSRGYTLPEQGTWHLDRKKAILKEHPEVKSLYGHAPGTAVVMLVAFIAHTYLSYHFTQYSWPALIFGAYTVGAWMSFVLGVVGHDSTHRLVFKSALGNKLVALISFLGVTRGPLGGVWMYEHMWHHNVVVDKALRFGLQNNSTLKKSFLALFFMVFLDLVLVISSLFLLLTMLVTIPLGILGLRDSLWPKRFNGPPFSRFPQSLNSWMLLNILCCIAYNFILIQFGWKAFFYQILAATFTNGLHPLGMRQVQEHYFVKKGQPTTSVYSSLSPFFLHVGYHVEHHDFPAIPWPRLPVLKQIADDHYGKELFGYSSYTHVLKEFLTNPGIPLDALFDGVPISEIYSKNAKH